MERHRDQFEAQRGMAALLAACVINSGMRAPEKPVMPADFLNPPKRESVATKTARTKAFLMARSKPDV